METALVTGTSSGIGFATALRLGAAGYRVFAGMRNVSKAQPLLDAAREQGANVDVLEIDVRSDNSVTQAFNVLEAFGDLSVLVNNAGVGGAAPLELTSDHEHRQMFETNYFGAVRCIKAALPGMRERGKGAIVNVTSLAGIYATPNQVAYSASKWALECAGEALASELRPFGIRVTNVEPGVVMTKIFENSAHATHYDKDSPYQPSMRRNGKVFAAGFRNSTTPEEVAETIYESIHSEQYRLRWPVGPDAVAYAAGRPQVSDEDVVALGDELDDEEHNRRFFEYFGIKL